MFNYFAFHKSWKCETAKILKYESSHNTPVFCTVPLHLGEDLFHHLVRVVARVESKEGLVDSVHQAGGQRTGF